MSEKRYWFDDGGYWSGDPNEPPVAVNPPCVHDNERDGVEFDCNDTSLLPWLADRLNLADELEAQVSALTEQRDAAVAALRGVEWIGVAKQCPYCFRGEAVGHETDCRLAAIVMTEGAK